MLAASDSFFLFQAEDGIRDATVTGVQTCALPISSGGRHAPEADGRQAPSRAGTRRRGGQRSPRGPGPAPRDDHRRAPPGDRRRSWSRRRRDLHHLSRRRRRVAAELATVTRGPVPAVRLCLRAALVVLAESTPGKGQRSDRPDSGRPGANLIGPKAGATGGVVTALAWQTGHVQKTRMTRASRRQYPRRAAMSVTVHDLTAWKARGERFIMLTAYDALTARVLDEAGVPLLLV